VEQRLLFVNQERTAKEESMLDTRRTASALGIAVAAGAAGYLTGLLTAPASGRETRRRLGRRLDEERTALARKGEHTRRAARRTLKETIGA
jgi:gas vesicle protein